MSTFGSVLRKPGQKLAPKAAPKRNVTRQKQLPTPVATPNSIAEEEGSIQDNSEEHPSVRVANTSDREYVTSNSVQPVLQQPQSETRSLRSRTATNVNSGLNLDSSSRLQLPIASDVNENGSYARDTSDSGITTRARSLTQSTDAEPTPQIDNGPAAVITSSSSKKRPAVVPSHGPRKRATLSRTRIDQTSPSAPATVLAQPTPPLSNNRTEMSLITTDPIRDAFEHAREQAAAVGNLAQAMIFPSTSGYPQPRATSIRSSTAPENTIQSQPAEEGTMSNGEGASQSQKRKRKANNRQAKSIEQQAEEVVANAVAEAEGSKNKRGVTPDKLRTHTIEENEVTMGELCKDRRWGQKSETERQMQENWPEIIRRRKEERERALLEAQSSRKKTHTRAELPNNRQVQEAVQSHPRMTIVGGNIVVEQAGRELDRMEDLNQQIAETVEILEDTDIYKRVNTSTVGVKNKIPAGQSWDAQCTDLFYRGLTMFGTDFMMISKMIPGKSRRQVKLKYNIEERSNWTRVKQSLNQKRAVDLGEYGQLAGLEFTNAADVYKQMEEDEKRLREEDEQRRREDGIVNHETADIPIDSIEGDGAEGGVTTTADGQPTDGILRGGSRLESIARHPTTQTKKRQSKKPSTTVAGSSSRRGRQATSSNTGNFEGTEERLGTIDEVAV